MMDWIEAEARWLGCDVLKPEAYAERTRTREFGEPGIVMVKPLPTEWGWSSMPLALPPSGVYCDCGKPAKTWSTWPSVTSHGQQWMSKVSR